MKKTYILTALIIAFALLGSMMIYRATELDKMEFADKKEALQKEAQINNYNGCMDNNNETFRGRIAVIVKQAKEDKNSKVVFPENYRWDLLETGVAHTDFNKGYLELVTPLAVNDYYRENVNNISKTHTDGMADCASLHPF